MADLMYEWGKAFGRCNTTLKNTTFFFMGRAACTWTFNVANYSSDFKNTACFTFVRPVYVCSLSLKSLAERRKLFSGAASFTSLYAIMLI